MDRNEEKGPVSFLELAMMVQNRVLNEDDLVRPLHVEEWQKAYRVVGLFYMAKRVAAPRPSEEVPPVPVLPSASNCCEVELSVPGAMSDLLKGNDRSTEFSSIAESLPSGDSEQIVTEGASRSSESPDRFAVVVSQAVKDWDRRHASSVPEVVSTRQSFTIGAKLIKPLLRCGSVVTTVIGRVLDGVFRAGKLLRIGTLAEVVEQLVSRQILTWWFRGGGAIAMALVVGCGVKTWAYYETVRYPNPDRIAAGMTVFPLFGACSSAEYYFLLVDVMIGGAVLGFFCSIYLEKIVDA